mgnify:CR=1 FL=1
MTKKNRLSHGQQRRVSANHARRLQKETPEPDESLLGAPREGLVISRFGQHADVEAEDGTIHRCNLRRTVRSLVTGDRVVWREGDATLHGISSVVEAVHPRQSELQRPDYYDGLKPVAANVDQIVVVSAVLPEFSTNIVDRYLVAAENIGVEPLLVLNKIDMLDDSQRSDVEAKLEVYRQIGYRVVCVSSLQGTGMADLQQALADRINVFVGQSGVGKSSLINSLMPEAAALTGDISDLSGLGQHTTTAARLYRFPQGGILIDSPGIREFALWHLEPDRVSWCFREFRAYLGGCKFRDCTHADDPGCLIREAVEQGQLSRERYDNYHRILQTMRDDKPTRAQRKG